MDISVKMYVFVYIIFQTHFILSTVYSEKIENIKNLAEKKVDYSPSGNKQRAEY